MYFLIDIYARNTIIYLIRGNYANLSRETGMNLMNQTINPRSVEFIDWNTMSN